MNEYTIKNNNQYRLRCEKVRNYIVVNRQRLFYKIIDGIVWSMIVENLVNIEYPGVTDLYFIIASYQTTLLVSSVK